MNESNPSVPSPTIAAGAKASGRPWVELGMALVVIGLLGLMFAGALFRPIYFDEREHLNNLWMISQGLHPYRDFWCTYPAAGYTPFLPIFRLLPENANILVVMRFLTAIVLAASFAVICAWSRRLSGRWWLPLLPAILLVTASGTLSLNLNDLPSSHQSVTTIGSRDDPIDGGTARVLTEFRTDGPAMFLAMVSLALLLGDPRGGKRIFALTCAVVSVAMMPKYLFILGAVHALDIIGRWLDKRLTWRTILENVAGVTLGLLAAWGLTLAALASPADAWRWAFLLQTQYQAHILATGHLPHFLSAAFLGAFLGENLWMSFFLAVGIGAFLFWAKQNRWRGQVAWVGYGLLIGVVVTAVLTKVPFDQYLPPVVLPLLFFFPFVGLILSRLRRPVVVEGVLLAITVAALLVNVRSGAQALAQTQLFNDLAMENQLDSLVPGNERVLGPFTLLFRRPPTFITYDEIWGDPHGFSSLVQDDPRVAREFTPEALEESLRQSKPAFIQLSNSLPPGWLRVMEAFLIENEPSYQRIDLRGTIAYIRKDLYNHYETPPPP